MKRGKKGHNGEAWTQKARMQVLQSHPQLVQFRQGKFRTLERSSGVPLEMVAAIGGAEGLDDVIRLHFEALTRSCSQDVAKMLQRDIESFLAIFDWFGRFAVIKLSSHFLAKLL